MVSMRKAAPCKDCGDSFPSVCMDFDHLPGSTKRKAVAELVNSADYSVKSIFDEINKCELVCSNCHRIRTWISR